MNRGHLLALIGLTLIGAGLKERGWFSFAAWFGADLFALGIAQAWGAHRIFGKRSDGSLPLWSWVAFLPLLLVTAAIWHLIRWFSREPPFNSVSERLVVGRRLLPSELEAQFENYVDLTAEFAEPAALRRSPAYRCFPILDGCAPSPEALREAVERLGPGKTFVHCAQGHGRAGLFALAVLLKSGAARTVEDGLRMLQAARPGIDLSRPQRECIERFAATAVV